MRLRDAIRYFEAMWIVIANVAVHDVERLGDVVSGAVPGDCFQVAPKDTLVWRPQNVNVKNVKQTNIASVFTGDALAAGGAELAPWPKILDCWHRGLSLFLSSRMHSVRYLCLCSLLIAGVADSALRAREHARPGKAAVVRQGTVGPCSRGGQASCVTRRASRVCVVAAWEGSWHNA